MDRAVALPQDDARVAELRRGQASARKQRVPHDAVLEREPELAHCRVAPEVLVRHEQHLRVRALLRERPLQRGLRVRGRAHRAVVSTAEGLDVGRRVHVGDGYDDVGDPCVGQRVPGVLDLGQPRHVHHGAACSEVGEHHLLLRPGQDVGRLGHEVHAAEDDVLRLRSGGRVAGQLERVAGHVRERDHLVALVVVTEHEHPLLEPLLRADRPGDQVGIGGRRQVAGTLDPALGGVVGAEAEREQRELDGRHGGNPPTRPQTAHGRMSPCTWFSPPTSSPAP